MFARQFSALVVKNFTVKFRRWPETLWEIIFPFFCGVLGGILALDNQILKKQMNGYTKPELFTAMGTIFMIAMLLITLGFIAPVIFTLQELITDRQLKIRDTYEIQGMSRAAY